jgi:hypothetical protein
MRNEELSGFTRLADSQKPENFLVGLRFTDPGAIAPKGDGLPYQSDQPYMALFEIEGVKGSTTVMPHPNAVAEVLATVDAPEVIEMAAGEYIAATNPLRRGLRMEPTRALVTYADAIKEALITAGVKVDDYPLAVLLGSEEVATVKALIGDRFSFGPAVVVGVGGGWIDPQQLTATDPDPDPDPEVEAPPVAEESQTDLERTDEMSTTTELTDATTVHEDDAIVADLSELDLSETAPWEGILAVEDIETGDGRFLMSESLTWRQLPLPIMMMTENPVGGDGHDGAKLAGRIDEVWRDGGEIWGRGVLDLGSETGREAHRLLGQQMLRGVSADIDKVTWDMESDADPLAEALGIPAMSNRIADGRLMGATLCVFPALEECSVWLTDDAGQIHADPEALAATGAIQYDRIQWFTPYNEDGALVASATAAVEFPVHPPSAHFQNPQLTEATPLTRDGSRIFGHIAEFGSCHIGFQGGRCVPVPKSSTNYSAFRRGSVETSDGTMVRTGPLVMDTVHPDLAMQASDAQAFYAHTGSAIADLAVGEDKFGIWVSGALRPGTTPEQLRVLFASDVSPDWRTVNGKPREMCAILSVNNSGFKGLGLVASAGGKIDYSNIRFVTPGHNAARIGPDGEALALVASSGLRHRGSNDNLIAEIDALRNGFEQLATQVKPQVQENARKKLEALAAKGRHPATRAPATVSSMSVARKKLARIRAQRIADGG